MNTIVYQKHVNGYDSAEIGYAVYEMLDRSGVLKLVTPGKKITIKPNLVGARPVDTACTTHPVVIGAVIDALRSAGATDITVADSPGGVYTPAHLKSVYSVCGLNTLQGAKLNMDCGFKERPAALGFCVDRFDLIDPIADADIVIDIAKLKTHSLTLLSAGVKNLFGCIPGLRKPEMHCTYPDVKQFSEMLVALHETVKPVFTLIDAVTAMEGNGPTGGTPRRCDMLFGSTNAYAADHIASVKMGIPAGSVEMLHIAEKRGLFDPKDITVSGDDIGLGAPFKIPDARSMDFSDRVPSILRKPFKKISGSLFRPRPSVDTAKCVGCGKCAESCPQHIINIVDKKAVFGKKGCISCFCCQEMCPMKAISVVRKHIL